MNTIRIQDLMQTSGVKFGTSGARGPVAAMTDAVCHAYVRAFLQHLQGSGRLSPGSIVAVGGDLRPSTERIMAAAARACADAGFKVLNCGRLPSPALAAYGMGEGIPTVMVTGSHIPDDRNGIKFTSRDGEILKSDEAGIRQQSVALPLDRFDEHGAFVRPAVLPPASRSARDRYLQRYLDAFPQDALQGFRLGVYQHSAVGRDLLVELLKALGAEVTALGRSATFVPVDTEAIRPEDVALASQWAKAQGFDAIVSTDGDSDRPLISDETGAWLRGDVAGILCASFLGASAVATPVSCNSAVERCGRFDTVLRTRIGSPYVIEAMQGARDSGAERVVGYEANGGFLLAGDFEIDGRPLPALPTRDAVLPILAILCLARSGGKSISELVAELPPRFTFSDRLQAFPTATSAQLIAGFDSGDEAEDRSRLESAFDGAFGSVASLDRTDGLRITFDSGEVVHLRPSGNAPEFRCYNEAASPERAKEMNAACLAIMARWREHAVEPS